MAATDDELTTIARRVAMADEHIRMGQIEEGRASLRAVLHHIDALRLNRPCTHPNCRTHGKSPAADIGCHGVEVGQE